MRLTAIRGGWNFVCSAPIIGWAHNGTFIWNLHLFFLSMMPPVMIVVYALIACGVTWAYGRVGSRKKGPCVTWQMIYDVKRERMVVAQEIGAIVCQQVEAASIEEYIELDVQCDRLHALDARLHRRQQWLVEMAKVQRAQRVAK